MASTSLDTLKYVDKALLTDIVRQDQRSATFEIGDWQVEPISHAKILETTGGLYHFSGHGKDKLGIRPWSVVLKILNNPGDGEQVKDDIGYWKRELDLFTSDIATHLPDALRLPRVYGAIEHHNEGWLWMEHIIESTGRRWSLEHFGQAARQLGRFDGEYLLGKPLPDYPWLSKPLLRGLSEWWVAFMDPTLPGNVWESSRVQASFGKPLRSRVLAFWAEIERFSDSLDRLPQVFCHNDLNRRNLMISQGEDGLDQVVAFDWAWCGNGALGLDAGWIIADALFFFDYDLARAAELEAVVFEEFMSGLEDVGWSGDKRLARLGYLVPLVAWMALLPGWTASMLDSDTMPMFGHAPEAVQIGWSAVAGYLTAHDDEARLLMRDLNLG